MALLLIFLGAVLPLLIAPGLLFHYDSTPKTVLLCLAAGVALCRVRDIPAEWSALRSRASGRWFVILAVALPAWFCVAAALSSRPSLSFFGSAWREFGVVTIAALSLIAVLVAAHLCLRPERIALLLRAATVAGLIVSIYGIAQYFDLDPFQSSQGYHALDGDAVIVRPPGTFGHADYFGWWLAIDFFCALAVVRSEGRRWQTLGVIAAGLISVATVLTGTRSAMLAIVVGALGLMLTSGTRIRARQVLPIAAAAGLFALFVFSPPGERLRARVAWAGHEPTGGARPLLWRDSLRMAGARPLTGFGPESFPAAFATFESDDLARLFPDFHHESPHNVALDALTSAGIPGLFLALAWAVFAFGTAGRALRSKAEAPIKGTSQSKFAAPLAAGILASGVAAMFSAAVMPPLLLTLLMLGALITDESPDRAIETARPGLLWAGFAVPAVAGVTAFACLLTVSDYRLARFQHRPGLAEYEDILRVPVTIAAEDVYCSRMLAASCKTQYDCWRTAVRAAARGTATADDPANAWYNLAQFTAAQNDIQGTQTALAHATQAAPQWFKPHWAMAELLARTGDTGNARTEAARASSLEANHNPEFSTVLAQLKSRIN